jgi:hypothetical protein
VRTFTFEIESAHAILYEYLNESVKINRAARV